ncbi:hypothetical protein HMPREF9145_1781 [Segatella salivae F0493]|uniref:Uncharacterized protein n=1 Tax=Segatella salivae F0493 TaxID=1395125 RepID=U2KJJ9_9BACT|nr:hypothetical protein HMPREF9145_1781 [Segatella salivae F0493]
MRRIAKGTRNEANHSPKWGKKWHNVCLVALFLRDNLGVEQDKEQHKFMRRGRLLCG